MRRASSLALAALLGGCSLAPPLAPPDVSVPAAFKEAPALAPDPGNETWRPAAPADDASRAGWWTVFGDPLLDHFESRVLAANQTLAAALARLEASRALVDVARAARLPRLDGNASVVRTRLSESQPLAPLPGGIMYNNFQYGVTAQYELDLFGRVRDSVKAARADAAAETALFESLSLSVTADVAQVYFLLRAADAELAALGEALASREATHRLFEQRLAAGDVSRLDVDRTRADLEIARAEVQAVARQRAQYEHALAVLLGVAPAEFSVAPAPVAASRLPTIPAGLPSTLLERRPDIAAAQRRMEAANARIGVARAAFYPLVNLTASAGFSAATAGELFEWGSRTWALGPLAGALIAGPLFDGGRNRANLARAEAALDAEIASYRNTVLGAFREVEDQLVAITTLGEQAASTDAATAAAASAQSIARARFEAGATGTLDLLDAQRSLLILRRQQAQLAGQRAVATAGLVRALGGGW